MSDPDELDLIRHFEYEIHTLAAYLSHLGNRSDLEATSANAMLEAMLVHARILIEFLVGRPPRRGSSTRYRHPDDIQPMDFLGVDWFDEGDLQPMLDDLDTQIVHLTKTRARISEARRQWVYGNVGRQLCLGLERFLRVLDPAHRDRARIATVIAELRSVVGSPDQV